MTLGVGGGLGGSDDENPDLNPDPEANKLARQVCHNLGELEQS